MKKKARTKKLNKLKKAKDEELKMKAKLESDIKKTRDQGQAFLNINDTWTPEQISVFALGMRGYPIQSSCRQVYGGITGFNAKYIESSSLERLRNAARNVGIKYTDTTKQEELQLRLFQFLVYGTRIHCIER